MDGVCVRTSRSLPARLSSVQREKKKKSRRTCLCCCFKRGQMRLHQWFKIQITLDTLLLLLLTRKPKTGAEKPKNCWPEMSLKGNWKFDFSPFYFCLQILLWYYYCYFVCREVTTDGARGRGVSIMIFARVRHLFSFLVRAGRHWRKRTSTSFYLL